MSNSLPIIKAIVLYLLLLGETIFLCKEIELYVAQQKYLTFEVSLALIIVLIALLLLYTFSLTIGLWKYVWPVLISPVVVCLGIYIYNFNSKIMFFPFFLLLILLFGIFSSYRSYLAKRNLIKFEPTFILRPANKAILLAFSLLAGLMTFSRPELTDNLNIGRKISQTMTGPIKEIIQNQFNNQMQSQFQMLQIKAENIDDKEIQSILKDAGISQYVSTTPNTNQINVNVDNLVETQVNKLLDPYRSFFGIAFAALVFLLFSSYFWVAYVIYVLTVWVVFALAKGTGLLKVEKIPVEQETLTF